MTVVQDTDLVIRELGRWDPSDVAYIRRVTFENWERGSYDLVLLLLLQPRPPQSAGWPDPKAPIWEVEIAFSRVRDLLLIVCGPWDIQTPGFALEDVRDRQWEGINLLVYDYEGLSKEGIRFGARSAQVRWCRPAEHPPNSPRVWREYPGVFGETGESL